ncbi:uncharacterized protein LOC131666929 [Phymastichus coffea]|uniref:uncharacterized protein LOC131666929 n=1 Tax=Phymastichus coffea TaxID=108790 RepID=UPI00273B2EA2|nr:uncharacterized protein LOC131666929 [Phymastichus coffea]
MGKFSSGWLGGKDEDPEEIKRKLRIKDLDQIRRNALGRKRDLRCKDSIICKPKSGFIKTLNQFASQRRKIEEATQITSNLISNNNKPRIIKQEVIQPKDIKGFFRAGVKGREVHRSDPEFEKFRNGVLQSDVLQILQSGHPCHRSDEKRHPNKSTKSPIEDDHADLKMEVAKILNNFNSSESSSFDLDNPGVIEFPSSPVIGRRKGAKKRNNQVKVSVNEVHQNVHSQENDISLVNNINKGERYRRRLFDETVAGVNNRCKEIPSSVLCNNELSRNSTPENVILYSKMILKQPVNKIKKHPIIDPSDPKIIESYVQICKFIGTNDLKNMFRNEYKDPEESAREALKLTYKRVLKDYLQRQYCQQSKSANQSTPSSNSEILLEPDSDIARRVKKNIAFLKQKESTTTPTNSTDSTKNFVNKVNARSLANTIENNVTKRKHAPSSKGSEPDVASSTQAIVDPKSVRAELTMNNIHPDRQELVARFLGDQKSFTSEYSEEHQERLVRKEKLYIDNSSKGVHYIHKSTKYIPAILRKNRSLVDCIAKEKATILSIEEHPSQRNKSSILDLNLDNIESERTPNTINESTLEAPKSKYSHMNAKYNQPSRINIPIVRDNRHNRNSVPVRCSQGFASPNSVQKNFILSQTYNLSPIKQHQSYSQNVSHDFRFCQLSQESKALENGNGMTHMVSFGDIQDRTNRLTICSQNQTCSQENTEHAYASQHSHPNYHYQPCETTNNCSLYQNQPHKAFIEPSYDRPICDCSTSLCSMHQPVYVPQNEYPIIPHSEYSFQESNTCSCCHQQNSLETMKNCMIPTRQPIKYHAAEGNRRQPIYNPNESCSFVHKQSCYPTSRANESSDFEYLDMLKMNYGGGGDRPQSFAPLNGNQRYIVQRQMPPSPPPPVCQQVAYRYKHPNANEACKMSDAYLHQLNRHMHSKRQ